jgi:hypothetical protein
MARRDTVSLGGTTGDVGTREPTRWLGWISFAGIMMITLGSFHAVAGFAALLKNDHFLVGSERLLVSVSYSTWGWAHLLLGVVVFAAGVGLLRGAMWARVVGIVVAVLSALVSMAFAPAYPVWASLIIALDIIVIYAIAVHGAEAKYFAID